MTTDQVNAAAAWWGAIVATIVGSYQLYRLWAGERISIKVCVVEGRAGIGPGSGGWSTVNVELINVGKATTLRRVVLEFRLDGIDSSREFHNHNLFLPRPFPAHDIWFGTSENDLSEELPQINDENASICIYHSNSTRPIRVPFRIDPQGA